MFDAVRIVLRMLVLLRRQVVNLCRAYCPRYPPHHLANLLQRRQKTIAWLFV